MRSYFYSIKRDVASWTFTLVDFPGSSFTLEASSIGDKFDNRLVKTLLYAELIKRAIAGQQIPLPRRFGMRPDDVMIKEVQLLDVSFDTCFRIMLFNALNDNRFSHKERATRICMMLKVSPQQWEGILEHWQNFWQELDYDTALKAMWALDLHLDMKLVE